MKIAFTGLLAAKMFGQASAIAAEKGAGFTASHADEFSASKKRRYVRHYNYVDAYNGESAPRYVVPSHDFIGGPDGYPGEYAWRRSLGQCVLDLGYGRWKGC